METHNDTIGSCITLLEMARQRARVGKLWAFTAGFIASAMLMAALVLNPLKRDADQWRSLALQWHAIADLRANGADQSPSDGQNAVVPESH